MRTETKEVAILIGGLICSISIGWAMGLNNMCLEELQNEGDRMLHSTLREASRTHGTPEPATPRDATEATQAWREAANPRSWLPRSPSDVQR